MNLEADPKSAVPRNNASPDPRVPSADNHISYTQALLLSKLQPRQLQLRFTLESWLQLPAWSSKVTGRAHDLTYHHRRHCDAFLGASSAVGNALHLPCMQPLRDAVTATRRYFERATNVPSSWIRAVGLSQALVYLSRAPQSTSLDSKPVFSLSQGWLRYAKLAYCLTET